MKIGSSAPSETEYPSAVNEVLSPAKTLENAKQARDAAKKAAESLKEYDATIVQAFLLAELDYVTVLLTMKQDKLDQLNAQIKKYQSLFGWTRFHSPQHVKHIENQQKLAYSYKILQEIQVKLATLSENYNQQSVFEYCKYMLNADRRQAVDGNEEGAYSKLQTKSNTFKCKVSLPENSFSPPSQDDTTSHNRQTPTKPVVVPLYIVPTDNATEMPSVIQYRR